jgi:hypothetical protein
LVNGVDYTATNGTTVVLTDALTVGQIVEIDNYLTAFLPTNALRTITTFTATAGQTTFSVTYTQGLIDVFYNGSNLAQSEYTATNGTSIILATACQLNDIVVVYAYSYAVGAYSGIAGSGTINTIPKFTASSTIGNSAITDDGTTVTLVSRALSGTSASFSSSVTANGLYANAGNSARFYRGANDYYWGINNDSNNYLNFGTFAANGTAYGTNPKLIIQDNGAATFSSSVQAATNFISVALTDSISVGTSSAENAKYNYLGHSGYWGIKTTTTGFNFALDTYNGGTPKNVLTITQAGAATFSSSVGIGLSPKTLLQINGGSGAYPTLGTNVTNSIFVGRNDGLIGMYLGYAADGNGWIQQMRNDSATAANLILQPSGGNVGIGTSSPLSITNGAVLHINGTTSGFLTMGYGGTRYLTMLATSGYAAVSTTGAVPLVFETNETEKMRIFSSGGLNVLSSTGDPFCIQLNSGVKLRADSSTQMGIVNAAITSYADLRVQNMTKASGSFRISHPLESLSKTHDLVHSFVEAPKADLIYRGKVNLVNGKGQANIDDMATMTQGTFEVLCKDIQCFTTNESGWDLVKGKVIGNIIYIESQNVNSTDEISWMVIGERKDKEIKESILTDNEGNIIVEPLKQNSSF